MWVTLPSSPPRGRLWVMLAVLCLGAFLASSSSIAVSPFLLNMASDLDTDLAAVANLVAFQSITWGIASLLAGALSDRLGRKPLLVVGLVILLLSGLAVSASSTYAWVVLWRLIGGIGGGTFMGAVFAAAADLFPPAERGRSLGWVITGQSLSLVLGVPIITLLGSWGGWRGAIALHSAVVLVAAVAVWLLVPNGTTNRARERPASGESVLRLLRPKVVALLTAGTAERICYGAVAVFLPTFFLTAYGVTFETLAIALVVVALGNLVGNVVGSQLSDRVPSRAVMSAVSLLATGGMALPVLLLRPGLLPSIALGFLYTFVDALVRPSLFAAISEVSSRSRGAVMGLNITFSSFGWLGATVVGGWLISGWGFGALGALAAAAGVAGAAAAALSWALPQADVGPATLTPALSQRCLMHDTSHLKQE